MARLSALLLTFIVGAVSAMALTSCGGGSDADLLPGTTADQIEANLDLVGELAGSEDCIGAEDAVAEVAAEVEELRGVDLKLKAALQEGTARLSEVVSRCSEETTEEETEPSLETDVGDEELEEDEKQKKEKPQKENEEASESEGPENEGPELPPQSNGKGDENGKGGGEPPAEAEPEETPPSGGVGPGVGVEE